MCSYKVVEASFEIWGMQTKCEELIQKVNHFINLFPDFFFSKHGIEIFLFEFQTIRDVLVLGHRQAFAWVDEWIEMTLADVRIYECEMQRKTNAKVGNVEDEEQKACVNENKKSSSRNSSSSSKTSSPLSSPKSPSSSKTGKSWFAWD